MSHIDLRILPLARRAISRWGATKQWAMVQEECAELIAAVNRWDRGRITIDELADEIADVIIVATQAAEMVPRDVFSDAISRKLDKLTRRLDEADEEANA